MNKNCFYEGGKVVNSASIKRNFVIFLTEVNFRIGCGQASKIVEAARSLPLTASCALAHVGLVHAWRPATDDADVCGNNVLLKKTW